MHTPGPWELSKWTTRFAVEASSDNYRGLMCEVHCEDFDPETAEANARLIAAAPELLAALQFTRSVMSQIPSNVLDEIEKAIAKATHR